MLSPKEVVERHTAAWLERAEASPLASGGV